MISHVTHSVVHAFVYGLSAWEIDACIVYHSAHIAHRLACRAFVAKPNHRTGRTLSAARRSVAILSRLTAVPQFPPTR